MVKWSMAEIATLEQALLSEVRAQEAEMASVSPRLRAVRQNAIRFFSETGLPTRKDEAWRWTDLSLLREPSRRVTTPPADFQKLDGPFADIDAWRLFFVNGVLQNAASETPPGVRAQSLRAALQDDPVIADGLRDTDRSPFLSLNTALLNDGAYICVAADTQAPKPLHLIFFNSGNAHIRNLVVLEARANVTLLESHYGPAGVEYFVNNASDVQLGEGARLAHYRDQAESQNGLHFHFLNARLDSHTVYDGFTLTRGARLSRNQAHVEIAGSDALCSLNGVSMLNGSQTADTTCIMDHRAPASQSRQMFRNVLAGKSQGIFQGLIRVAKPAQRTDATQQIKAMLLSPHAVQNSKPELEILADDVKCAHGASVGQLDEAALFYLRARGIDEAQARALLIGAFLDDAVAQIQGSAALDAGQIQLNIRDTINTWLAQKVVHENV
jgi:Fe-S cluster assembly protein SufD